MREKRIISLVILLSMVISLFSFGTVASAAETPYQHEVNFLIEAGILSESFVVGEEVTRGQLAEYMVTALYQHADFSAQTGVEPFIDVPADHTYYSYIMTCKQLGIVNGDYNNNYNPDNIVTMPEVITVAVNALGYTTHANAFGGYPTGYYEIARQVGISKGVDMSVTPITSEVVAKIIYNALFADSVAIKYISNDGMSVEIQKNSNYLSSRMNIYEYDAIITDNGLSSLNGSTMGDTERVVIEDFTTGRKLTAFVNGTDAGNYLGYRVKIYIKDNEETGRYEVIYVAPHSKTNVVTLYTKDIVNSTANYIEYEENPNNLTPKKYSFGDALPKVIFNGKKYIDKTVDQLIPQDGIVTLIDNDGNNQYEVVNILSFNYVDGDYNAAARNIIVDSVITNETSEYIGCRFNPANSLRIDKDTADYRFIINEEKASMESLMPMDVVSVAECPELVDGKKFYYLVVANNIVTGTVSGTSSPDGINMSDGKEYKLSSSITDIKPAYINRIVMGENKLYLDVTGKIAYVNATTMSAKNYAYLINVAKKSAGDDYVIAKILNKDGAIETLTLNSKVKIDGVTYSTADSQITALSTRSEKLRKLDGDTSISRPIVIEKNSNGYITVIDTDTPNYSGTADSIYLKQTSIGYTEEEIDDDATLKAGYRNPGVFVLYQTARSVAGRFFVTMDTTVIAVPDVDTYGINDFNKTKPIYSKDVTIDYTTAKKSELEIKDENYKVITANALPTDINYDIQAYDVDVDTGIAGMVVVRGKFNNAGEEASAMLTSFRHYTDVTPMAVFLRKTTAYDAEKEKEVTKIYYNQAGVEKSATIDFEIAHEQYNVLVNGSAATGITKYGDVEPLKEGDIIRVRAQNGKLLQMHRVLRTRELKENGYGIMLYPNNEGTDCTNSATFSIDMRSGGFGVNDTYKLSISYAETVKSGIARTILPSYGKKFIEGTEWSIGAGNYDYQYINFNGASYATLVTIDTNGNVKVTQGKPSDIITANEVGASQSDTDSTNYDKASVVIYKHQFFQAQELIIINGIENLN